MATRPAGPWPSKEATERLERLADVHGIELTWALSGEPFDAVASSGAASRPGVRVPRPRSPRLYLVALHEFGHVICRPAWRRIAADEHLAEVAACEAAAWWWALHNLGGPALRRHVSAQVIDRTAWECLGSYLKPVRRKR